LIRHPPFSGEILRKSQKPPEDEVARFEVITIGAGTEASHGVVVSDQDPRKESLAFNAEAEATAFSASISQRSLFAILFIILNSRNAVRETASQFPLADRFKNPNSAKRD
jgi:hypothetical protein